MGLRISLDTDTLSRGDTVTLAKMLEVAFPGALADALGTGHTETITLKVDTRDVTAALADIPPPTAPTGAVPVPPAPPSGAASATPPAPGVSPAVELDVNGLPWDGRIHSTPSKRNADGSWRAKRNVADDLVATVTAELRQNMAAPGAPVPQSPPAPTVPPPPPGTSDSATPVSEPSPVPPVSSTVQSPDAPPPPPAVPAPPAAPAALSGPQIFARYMERVTAAQSSGKVTTADVASIATGLGLVGTAGLLTRPDLVPQAEAALDALLTAAG